MTTPERIWAWENKDPIGSSHGWNTVPHDSRTEYVRRDPAVLAELPEVRDQWQPIETAPKDGSSILGYWSYLRSDTHYIQPIRYLNEQWLHDWDHSDEIKPTHWMPLPAPPAAIREGRT